MSRITRLTLEILKLDDNAQKVRANAIGNAKPKLQKMQSSTQSKMTHNLQNLQFACFIFFPQCFKF